MGLRCLLGHDYGDPETEHEREEAGSEVITTVREVERCRRCGETRVVSENKEVRSIDGLRGEPATGAESTAGAEPATGAESTAGAEPATGAESTTGAEASGARGGTDPAPGTAEAADVSGSVDSLVDDAEPSTDPSHPAVDDGDDVDEEITDDAVIVDGEDEEPVGSTADETDEETTDDAVIVDGEDENPVGSTADETDEEITDDAVIVDGEDEDPVGSTADETDEEITDDAVIVDGEDEEPTDGKAETPGRSPVTDSTEAPDPADPTDAPDPADDDGVILDDDTPGEGDEELTDPSVADPTGRGGGVTASDAPAIGDEPIEGESEGWPDHDGTDAEIDAGTAVDNVETNGAADAEPTSGFDEIGRSTGGRTTVDGDAPDRDLVYRCPDCGHAEPVGASSMRAGDICPECRRAYIEEHVRN